MNWYLKVLKQYANFKGRACRKEFWMFALFNYLFGVIAMILDRLFDLTFWEGFSFGVFSILYFLGVFIPSLAVSARRVHDIGKSVWVLWEPILVFLAFSLFVVAGIYFFDSIILLLFWWILAPIVSIWLLVLFLTRGDADENKYGLNPKHKIVYRKMN